MRTYTDKRIALSQDINNTWQLVAAGMNNGSQTSTTAKARFIELYAVVREASEISRLAFEASEEQGVKQ